MIKFCYHYQAEIIGYGNTTLKRIAGVNVSEVKLDGPEPYRSFVKEIEQEFCKGSEYTVITNLSFLHCVYDK